MSEFTWRKVSEVKLLRKPDSTRHRLVVSLPASGFTLTIVFNGRKTTAVLNY